MKARNVAAKVVIDWLKISPTFKNALYNVACRAQLPALARRRQRRRLLILTYHGLRNGAAPIGTSWSLLPLVEFERQVDYLARHYHIADIDDAVEKLRAGDLVEPTACLTFDDGYRNNRAYALPVLERYGVPATIYLATGMIGTRRLLWTIELDLALQQTSRTELDLRFLGLGRVPLTGERHRAAVARSIIGVLKSVSPARRDDCMTTLRGQLECEAPRHGDVYDFMTWDDVSAMERSGLVRFGAHTVNHEIVARLDDAALAREIGDSISAVRERTHKPSATFAYPNGTRADFDARAMELLRHVGSTGAVTTIEGLNDQHTDAFELRRFNVGSDMTLAEFQLLTAGALSRRARI
jgi:peptidoglycan/xylan/chitin deacetylase (PgdA/CDA1 family)